jgi:hypothetical protein
VSSGAAVCSAALALLLAGCGGESRDEPAATIELAEANTLFDRYDRLLASIDFDREEAEINELPPGDRALYVLFTVDGEINNGGFSQYLFNSTAELHDEAVENARLVGATETAALLERLPDVLEVESISGDRAERQALLDRLRPEQEAELARMDEEWFDGISVEIETSLSRYLSAHPDAFSEP